MPTDIKIMYWNVEDFGPTHTANPRRFPFVPRCNFLAKVIINADIDIFCLIELKQNADAYLLYLQAALDSTGPAHWYYDFVPGALSPGAMPPYNTNADVGYTVLARHEGYAVFWRQNIAKFIMQRADPIDPMLVGGMGPMVANTQSFGVRSRGVGLAMPIHGIPLGVDIVVPGPPGGLPYLISTGTVGAPVGAVAGGTVLPMGTTIGPGGVALTGAAPNQIIIPGNYTLTMPLTLPPPGTVLVPQHVLSLVLTGRQQVAGGAAAGNFTNFNPAPGAVNNWPLLRFPDGIGAFYPHPRLVRRPAYCTIKANGVGGAELIPITMYHTPLQAFAASQGMRRSAYSRSMYQAFDHTIPGAYINNNRAILGGDFNKRLDPMAGHYRAFTDDFGPTPGSGGGADCRSFGPLPPMLNMNIRANFPPGAPPPVYPPPPAVLTNANNPMNKSSIALRHNITNGLPVLSMDTDHYRRSPVDNVFYRGFMPLEAPLHAFSAIYDLMKAITGGGPPGVPLHFHIPQHIIQAFQNLLIFMPGGVAPGGVPAAPAAIPNVLDPGTLLADIMAGGFGQYYIPPLVVPGGGWIVLSPVIDPPAGAGPFAGPPLPPLPPLPPPLVVTPARRAAEFLRLFVSDHLPVIFNVDI